MINVKIGRELTKLVSYPDLLSTKPKARSGQVIRFIFYWLFTILPTIDCEGAKLH